MSRDGRISFAHAAEEEQLKTEQAGKRLQFDQAGCQVTVLGANSEINHQKVRVRGFIRHLQSGGNRAGGVAREFRCTRFCNNLVSRGDHFIAKFTRQKNRCFRNPEIGRPFLGFIHTTQERRIFLRAEVGVEAGAKFRMHGFETTNV